MKAEAILRKCRSMVADLPTDVAEAAWMATGRLDINMVRQVLKKPESKFETSDEVGANFVLEINKAMKEKGLSTPPLVSPWVAPPPSQAKAASSSSSSSKVAVPNVMQYSSDGLAVGAYETTLRSAS